MRIALITTQHHHQWGGTDSLWGAMADEALAAGHQLGVFGCPGPGIAPRLQRLIDAGVKLFTWRSSRRRVINRMLRTWQFREVLAFRPDVVYVNQSTAVLMAHLPGLRHLLDQLLERQIPYVLMSHTDPDWPGTYTSDWVLANRYYAGAARAVVNSEYGRRAIERKLARRLDNVAMIPNPPNLTSLDAAPWPATEHPAPAIVARYDIVTKAQDVLLEALAAIRSEGYDWHFDFYGSGLDRSQLEVTARYFGVDGQVTFHDFATDVRAVWNRHQALVLPSRTELFPVAMVEAMVCGRPVFATPAAGVVDWVRDGANGLLAAACSAPAIAELLRRAWQARDRWQSIGETARTDAMQFLSPWPGRALLEVLSQAASAPNQPTVVPAPSGPP